MLFLRNMKAQSTFCLALLLLSGITSCSQKEDIPSQRNDNEQRKMGFDITVTREGKAVQAKSIAGRAATKGNVSEEEKLATMNADIPFGLVGIDLETNTLLIDNKSVFNHGSGYTGLLDGGLWELPATVAFSAYYPYVHNVEYDDELTSYSIPFTGNETQAGPLVSKTVERAINQLNMLPLEFRHITNDIGYKICDVTTDPQLQGLIHLRKLTATNVASAGIFVNDITLSRGIWHRQGYYRDIVLFEGDAVLGVGSQNEKFVGADSLTDRMADSNRYYSIPDEIEVGKQCVELLYDVDAFTVGGFTYPAMKNQVARYMLYGVLPDNLFEYGKQYTFHLGLDTGKLYSQIAFSASVSDWETKIYENNDEF